MGNKNVKVLIKTRSTFERERVKDSLSFFKLQTRSHVDRRRVKDRRSSLKKEAISHYPERRVRMLKRRRLGDRRGMLSRWYEYFERKSALFFKRTPFTR